jgi:hypothetical protein
MSKTIKIKRASLEADKYGNIIKVNMIGIWDENGKHIKWIKLNQKAIEAILEKEIAVSDELASELINPTTNA